MLPSFYIYILHSVLANKYYVGFSENPWLRFEQHQSNSSNKYTGKFKDWELVCVFKVEGNKSDALKIEKFIKSQKSKIFILKLLDERFIPEGKLAQLVRVPHVRD